MGQTPAHARLTRGARLKLLRSGADTTAMASPTPFLIAASDLTFLWATCKRCFFGKVVARTRRPPGVFPAVFTKLDRGQRAVYSGLDVRTLSESLPSGTIRTRAFPMRSRPLTIPGCNAPVVLRGSLDSALFFTRGTTGIADFKTTQPDEHTGSFYWPQLMAYAIGCTKAADGATRLEKLEHLGLMCFDPDQPFELRGRDLVVPMTGHWVPVERNDAQFFNWLREVVELLERETVPEPGERCPWCSFQGPVGRFLEDALWCPTSLSPTELDVVMKVIQTVHPVIARRENRRAAA